MKKSTRVGPYTLLTPLSAGGHVWLASVDEGRRRVVLKLARTQAQRAALLHEADLSASVDHPNIARMLECAEAGDVLWLASGHVAGPHAPLTLANFRQLLLALVHVHAHGVLHGSLGPDHLLLDEDGNLRLAGFARAQRAADNDVLDVQADLHAAAAVLYLILTGKPPVPGAPPAPPSLVAAGLGTSFDSLMARLLAPDSSARHTSAFEVLRDFDAACKRGVRTAPQA
jgi:serine/threonine protein kinase